MALRIGLIARFKATFDYIIILYYEFILLSSQFVTYIQTVKFTSRPPPFHAHIFYFILFMLYNTRVYICVVRVTVYAQA